MSKSLKSINVGAVRDEMKRRLGERGFKIVTKSTKKFWAIKPISHEEITHIVKEVTVLMGIADLDGGPVRRALKFFWALLLETANGAAGISLEI